MARYKVTLAYDGSRYSGFQRQAGACTIQGEVEAALKRTGWQGRAILAAGRTDTGVHASGQVIAFDLEWRHTEEDLRNAINASLPNDIAVQAIQPAAADFHPRYGAAGRSYRYSIYCKAVRDPLRDVYAWRVWPAVDPERLRQAAAALTGRHDFAAFGSPPQPGGSTTRTVLSASWEITGTEMAFEITAQAFLYHMVRRLTAIQVEIGQGRLEVDALRQRLRPQDPATARMPPYAGLAPPQGLVLSRIYYSDDAPSDDAPSNDGTE